MSQRLLLFFTLLLFTSSCSLFYDEVKVDNIQNVELVRFENNGLVLDADVDINNPNFFAIEVVSSDLKLYLDSNFLGKAKFMDQISVAPKTDTTMRVTIQTVYKGKFKETLRGIMGLAIGKEMELIIEGTVRGKAYGWEHDYPILIQQDIKL